MISEKEIQEMAEKAAEREAKLKPLRLEAKLDLAYDLISGVHSTVCNSWFPRQRTKEVTENTMEILTKIIDLSHQVKDLYK